MRRWLRRSRSPLLAFNICEGRTNEEKVKDMRTKLFLVIPTMLLLLMMLAVACGDDDGDDDGASTGQSGDRLQVVKDRG